MTNDARSEDNMTALNMTCETAQEILRRLNENEKVDDGDLAQAYLHTAVCSECSSNLNKKKGNRTAHI